MTDTMTASAVCATQHEGTAMPSRLKLPFLGLLLLGTAVLAGEPGVDNGRGGRDGRDARAALFRADNQLARAMTWAGPVEGFIKSAAGDITYLHPGAEVIVGRAATLQFLEGAYADFNEEVRTGLHRLAGDVSADGSLGYTFGWLDENRSPKITHAVELAYGRYVAVWRREGRDWEVVVFLRLDSTGPLGNPPTDARILDGEPGVRAPGHPEAHALGASIADARFADLSLAQGYSHAFDAYAADAAIAVTNTDVFWNRAGVNEAFSGWTPDQSLRWHPLRSGAAASGDLAWTIGHGAFILGIGGPEQRFPSKYLTVWLRTAGGWRFLIDGGNPRPAESAP